MGRRGNIYTLPSSLKQEHDIFRDMSSDPSGGSEVQESKNPGPRRTEELESVNVVAGTDVTISSAQGSDTTLHMVAQVDVEMTLGWQIGKKLGDISQTKCLT